MGYKSRFSTEEKSKIVDSYLTGEIGKAAIIERYGIRKQTLDDWVRLYKARGSQGLTKQSKSRKYTPDMKKRAVGDYLSEQGSLPRFV